jgi:hypothetical protein
LGSFLKFFSSRLPGGSRRPQTLPCPELRGYFSLVSHSSLSLLPSVQSLNFCASFLIELDPSRILPFGVDPCLPWLRGLCASPPGLTRPFKIRLPLSRPTSPRGSLVETCSRGRRWKTSSRGTRRPPRRRRVRYRGKSWPLGTRTSPLSRSMNPFICPTSPRIFGSRPLRDEITARKCNRSLSFRTSLSSARGVTKCYQMLLSSNNSRLSPREILNRDCSLPAAPSSGICVANSVV